MQQQGMGLIDRLVNHQRLQCESHAPDRQERQRAGKYLVDRVHPVRGQPVHLLYAVVDSVELPQGGHGMADTVGGIITDIGHHDGHQHLRPKGHGPRPLDRIWPNKLNYPQHEGPRHDGEPCANNNAINQHVDYIVQPVASQGPLFWVQRQQTLQWNEDAGQNKDGSIVHSLCLSVGRPREVTATKRLK